MTECRLEGQTKQQKHDGKRDRDLALWPDAVARLPHSKSDKRVPQNKKRTGYRSTFPFSPSSVPLLPPPLLMAIQKEPGQKGVNWSNIAVGEHPFLRIHILKSVFLHPYRCYHEHGAFSELRIIYILIDIIAL
jgi:hypothetical protein